MYRVIVNNIKFRKYQITENPEENYTLIAYLLGLSDDELILNLNQIREIILKSELVKVDKYGRVITMCEV